MGDFDSLPVLLPGADFSAAGEGTANGLTTLVSSETGRPQ